MMTASWCPHAAYAQRSRLAAPRAVALASRGGLCQHARHISTRALHVSEQPIAQRAVPAAHQSAGRAAWPPPQPILPPLPAQPTAVSQARRPQSAQEPWRVTQQTLDDVCTMFRTMPYEHDYWVDKAWVTGTIPPELQGTYLRNGPALQVSSGRHPRHFMDGDGCVLSLAFPGNGAMPRFTNRYVRTKGFVDEQAAGKPVHRNAFTRGAVDGSPLFNPFNLNFKNVANTNVLFWAGRLWALWEVGLPYELQPHTLDTVGESTMDGQISQRLAGHYRVVTEADGRKTLVAFGAQVSFTGMHLEFYEFDESGRVQQTSQHKLEGMDIMFIHDMLVTEHWYIIIMGPVQFDGKAFVTEYMTGTKSLAELLQYNKEHPSKVFLYPRPGRTPPAAAGPRTAHVITAPPSFSWHHINAYERRGGAEVVLDTISWQDIAFDVTQYTVTSAYYQGGCRSQLYRMVLDLPSSQLVSHERVLRRTVEFPTPLAARVTGRPYRHAYMAADAVNDEEHWGPAQAVIKVTLPVDPDLRQSPTRHSSRAGHTHVDTPVLPAPQHVNPYTPLRQPVPELQREQHLQGHGGLPGPSASRASTTPLPPQQPAYNHVVAWQPRTIADQGSLSPAVSSARGASHTSAPGDMEGVVCEEWRPGPRCFPQEPMFVPRPSATSEDDGWLIVGVHNSETLLGEIAILDARNVSAGPVATIHLPHALPCGLHGTWTDTYLGPDPADLGVPAWRVPHKVREL